jgi:formylglycine-generating enzyme required for sulfatase activity
MIHIPGGTVTVGAPRYIPEHATPHPWDGPYNAHIASFDIGAFAVTRQEYQRFIDAGGPTPVDWDRINLQNPRFPATGVSWENATAYAQWLGSKTGIPFRLPSAAEWETAARGGLVRDSKAGPAGAPPEDADQVEFPLFPWGNDPPMGRACLGRKEADAPCEIDAYEPNGYGLYNVVGNVWEWCTDLFVDCNRDVPRNAPTGKDPRLNRVLRGGSFMTPASGTAALYIPYIHEDPPDLQHVCLGFRLAADAGPAQKERSAIS